MKGFLLAILALSSSLAQARQAADTPHITPFEKSGFRATASYEECRDWYFALQRAYPEQCSIDTMGVSDGGFPIFVFRISAYPESATPLRVLIMNNIHPGEPEGTDASMLLARRILENKKGVWDAVRNGIDLHIICQYNTDGTVNRGCCSRANQNGPDNYGFRANARNLDLNRDFAKADSKNAQAFARYFARYKFHLFADNHTSNGADYQYTLTWFHTRPEKLHNALVAPLEALATRTEKVLLQRGYPTAPYVETRRNVPDSGIVAFWETPRFATGYAAMHHCLGFTVETHMWKPFEDRVWATLEFEEVFLRNAVEMQEDIFIAWRKAALDNSPIRGNRKEYIAWKLDETRCDSVNFKGYTFNYVVHPVTGLPLLHYTATPWQKNIPYYKHFIPTDSVVMPRMYFIPQAWREVVFRLQNQGIDMRRLTQDSLWQLRATYIQQYQTGKNPYEGHYLHSQVQTRDTFIPVQLYRGDYYVIVTPANRQALAQLLEPRSPDSYFAWGFFDAVLQQKEGFSDYVWADKAQELLEADPMLMVRFQVKKKDPVFAADSWAQLSWIYKNSRWYEPSHNRVPVYRMD